MSTFRKLRFIVAAAIGLALAASTASAQTKLRLAVETTSGDPLNVMLSTFRDELAATAGSDLTLEFFDGGALGDETALMELIRAGEVQVVPIGSDVVQLDKKFSVFDMPFLFPDKAIARRLFDGELGKLLADSLRATTNLQVLAFGELGFRTISNNVRPIEKPEDLKGLKLRTPGSETRLLVFSSLGAAPTPMPLGEVYVALRQGVIDGQENPLSVIKEFSLFEVQKYISLTNHIYTPITLAMNGATWDSLSPEVQAKVTAAAQKGAEKTRELSDKSDATLVNEFKTAGVLVNSVDPAAFQAAAAPIGDKIAEIATPEFMTKVLGLVQAK